MTSVLDILFYSYLTDYNIRAINRIIELKEDGLTSYLNAKLDSGIKITDSFINSCVDLAKERYEEMRYNGIRCVPFDSQNYPKALRTIATPPPMIFMKGQVVNGKLNHVAVVGSRKITAFAEAAINELVSSLSTMDVSIVSGLAYGIDTLAHAYALKYNLNTIAVLPNPLNHVYPKENLPLANRILDNGGTILSELPIGINLGKRGFVQRNRLQSGLSDIVIPIEMGAQSGTMHTIQFAFQQKKKVCVVELNPETQNLSEYSGIKSLTSDKSRPVHILKGYQELNNLIHSSKKIIDDNGELYKNHLIDDSGNNEKAKIISSFRDESSQKVHAVIGQLSNLDNIELLKKQELLLDTSGIKKQIQMILQELLISYINKYPALNYKELETIVKKLKTDALTVVEKKKNESID